MNLIGSPELSNLLGTEYRVLQETMKFLIPIYFVTSLALFAAPLQIELHKPDLSVDNDNYESQIIISFNEMLESNDAASKEFKPIIAAARSKSGGRFRAAVASPLNILTSYSSLKDEEGSKKVRNSSIVIVYSFRAETDTGLETVATTFALFEVVGTYTNKEDGSEDQRVIAYFKGFHEELNSELLSTRE